MVQEEKVDEAQKYSSYNIDLKTYRKFGQEYLTMIHKYCKETVIDKFEEAINLKVVDGDKTIAYLIKKEQFLDRLQDLLNTIASSVDLNARPGLLD